MYPDNDGWSGASWSDYSDALGTDTNSEAPTSAGTAASLLEDNFYCMRLTQKKKMAPLKSAGIVKEEQKLKFHSKNTFDTFICTEDEEDDLEAMEKEENDTRDTAGNTPSWTRKARMNQRQRR